MTFSLNFDHHKSMTQPTINYSSRRSCESEESSQLRLEQTTESSEGLEIELKSLESRSASESEQVVDLDFSTEEGRLHSFCETALTYFDRKTNINADPQVGVSLLRRAAVQGSSAACFQLAEHYQTLGLMHKVHTVFWYQQVMRRDPQAASQCFQKCEELYQGFIHSAHISFSSFYSYFRSIEIFAHQNDPFAQYLLGYFYDTGCDKEVKVDFKKAFYWYKKAADQLENADIYFDLGLRYARGDGCKKSNRKAISYLKKAERFKHHAARIELGILYFQKGKYKRALGYLSTENQSGDPRVDFTLGEIYYYWMSPKQTKTAILHYKLAANAGHAEAQAALGFIYVSLRDNKQAAFWFQCAANQSHFVAKYKLAVLDYYGLGIKKNRKRAFDLLCDIAQALKNEPEKLPVGFDSEMGPNVEHMLGRMYYQGKGTDQNIDEGIRWLLKASAHGHVAAKSYMRLKRIG